VSELKKNKIKSSSSNGSQSIIYWKTFGIGHHDHLFGLALQVIG